MLGADRPREWSIPFLDQKRDQVGLRNGLIADVLPIGKCLLSGGDLRASLGLGPESAVIVVGDVTFLLQLHKGLRHIAQSLHHIGVFAGKWEQTPVLKPVGSGLHGAVVEGPGEHAPELLALPVRDRFANEEMEESIIGGRNGTPQTGLPGLPRFLVHQSVGLVEEIVVVGHGSDPVGILSSGLFRFTAKAEIRDQAPVFVRVELIEQRGANAAGDVGEVVVLAGRIGEYDAKEDGWFSGRIPADTMFDAHDVFLGEFADCPFDVAVELSLVDKTGRDDGHSSHYAHSPDRKPVRTRGLVEVFAAHAGGGDFPDVVLAEV